MSILVPKTGFRITEAESEIGLKLSAYTVAVFTTVELVVIVDGAVASKVKTLTCPENKLPML